MTLDDIARQAKVSRSTVSLVLRDSPLVARRTRERVLGVIDRLGYVYNRGAASMRSGRSGTIGLIVCEITNPFYAEMTAGIERVLDQSGLLTFLANTQESLERQDRFLQRLREQGADGIILSPAEGTEAGLIADLRRWRLPFVQVLRDVANSNTDYVAPDYRLGMEMATEHLIERGHRRIAYLGGIRRTSASSERMAGYLAAIARHHLPPGPVAACPSNRAFAAEAVARLLRGAEPPSAILCYNDIIALGVLAGLTERGLVPGQDVAVVGFDNVAEAAASWPRLTTIATQAERLGEAAARLLLRRIADPEGRVERVILPPRLIRRDT